MDEGSFLFVQETGTGYHEATTRSRIKMHVMDRVVSQKQATKRGVVTDEEENRQKREQVVTQRDIRLVNNTKNIHPELKRAQQRKKVNLVPFSDIQDMLVLSGIYLEVNNQTKLLLHHFLNYRSRSLCTITVETGWLKYAIRDPALFNSTLYHWALLNHGSLPEKFQSKDVLLQLKGVAIAKINAHLSNPNDGTVSDEAIASVACLANANLSLYLMHGDIEEAKIHFKGLNAMVRNRNGVHTLGFGGLITRIVKWTDTCHAALSNSELSFEERNPSSYQTHFQSSPRMADTPPFRLLDFKILDEMRTVSEELSITPRGELSIERRVSLGQWLLTANRDLLRRMHTTSHSGPEISTIVATAALLYMQSVLRGMSRLSRVIKALTIRLKESIISALEFTHDIFAQDPASLSWVLLVGVLASGNEIKERSWFLKCLGEACDRVDLMQWESLRQMMDAPNHFSPQPFLWILERNVLELSPVTTRLSVDDLYCSPYTC